MKELIRRCLAWCVMYGWIVLLLMGISFYIILGAEFAMWHCHDNQYKVEDVPDAAGGIWEQLPWTVVDPTSPTPNANGVPDALFITDGASHNYIRVSSTGCVMACKEPAPEGEPCLICCKEREEVTPLVSCPRCKGRGTIHGKKVKP